MAKKYYCIIERDNCFYVPIKAHDNPYYKPDKPRINPISYLACRPNFFGGNMEDDESSVEVCLAREAKEESQDKIDIVSSGFAKEFLFSCHDRKNEYNFYLVKDSRAGEYFAGSSCDLDMGAGKRDSEKEMSCILKIPKADLAGKNLGEFLTVCKSLGGALVDLNLSPSKAEWNDQGTKDAFQALLGKVNPE